VREKKYFKNELLQMFNMIGLCGVDVRGNYIGAPATTDDRKLALAAVR